MLLFLEKIFLVKRMEEDTKGPPNYGWHLEQETVLKAMEKQCDIYYKHHTVDFKYYHQLATRFNVPILVISALNALCAIALNDFLAQKFVSILNAILSAGTGVLGSIQLYLKVNEKMTNALRSSIAFRRLGLKIAKEMTLKPAERSAKGSDFLSECSSEFNQALEQGNPVERLKLPNHMMFETMDKKIGETSTSSSPKRIGERLFEFAKSPVIGFNAYFKRRDVEVDIEDISSSS